MHTLSLVVSVLTDTLFKKRATFLGVCVVSGCAQLTVTVVEVVEIPEGAQAMPGPQLVDLVLRVVSTLVLP